ncbi:SGS domain-containing protein [Delphinella strobiligena]|nr:SGS domain-containing protein [Delphinella strobiligena]
MDQAKRGTDALGAGNFADAIKEFTAAIKVSPTSPDYHIKRSMAYQRSSPPDYVNALADAEKAVLFAQQRAKRELIIQAQLRRAIGLFGLERYADAKFVLEIVKRLDPKEKTLAIWESKIATKLAALPEDDAKRQVTVQEKPDISTPKPAESDDSTATESGNGASELQASATLATAQTPANKIRHDWYQSSDSITLTLLAKGVPKDKAVIDMQPRSLNISFPIANDSSYEFSLDPLYASVDVSDSTYKVMSTKIEVILKKAQAGQKWHALESSEPVKDTSEATNALSIPSEVLKDSSSTTVTPKGPEYPTSSRNGPKNWDKLAELDNNDDEGEGDEVNKFFQKLYSGADADTRRAMMKSYSESNGTALSTNWSEVGSKKMETTPPEGMEAKSW